ncbi:MULTISPECIES: alpha/beta fold hydrolase [Actinomycetaceae]|uniref:alpha/beta fold hydrolase n=1 Tax=Actinomycetaceae TaxID=2049 RepID=UPI000570197B|nr:MULTISPECIES: alpha/beta fold hydrolase [Actinomycetaceae]MDK8352595.1 alpha/beta fold hydrolase [Actinotignum sanguinis]
MSTPVLFLHGLGETPQAWNGVINEFESIDALTPTVVDQPSGTPWSLHERTDELAASLNDPVDVVGLSLGAVMGLDLAIRHPHMVRSLFLSAPQARPPKALMRIQSVLMRVLPERLVCPSQISKQQLLEILRQISAIDFEPELGNITVPTTIACGSKDRANLPAARTISQQIPHARLIVVPDAGHQWHQLMPTQFAHELKAHWNSI